MCLLLVRLTVITPHPIFQLSIQNTQHTYTNINNNLQITCIMKERKKFDSTKQYRLLEAYETQPNYVINEQIDFQAHIILHLTIL